MTALTTRFNMIRDINGYNGFGIPNSNENLNTTLAAGAEQHTTVLTDYAYYLAVFYYAAGSTVIVSNTGTASLPGGSFASSNSAINPVAWLVKSGSTLSFITNDVNAYVSIAYYALPDYGTASI